MNDTKTLQTIIKAIKDSKRSIVCAHQNPDGDTLGSMLAIGAILKGFGHSVDHVMSDPVPEIYEFLPFTNLVKAPNNPSLSPDKYDLAFSLDCGSLKRLGKAGELWSKAKTTINIDHHISNEKFAHINWIEAEATSTGQLVFWLAKEIGINITSEISTLLYTTLLTDTSCFANSNTNSEAFNWAADLVNLGANHRDVYKKIFLERNLKSMKVFGFAINNINIIENGELLWTYVDKNLMINLSATSEDTEDIADFMMRTKGAKLGIFFREDKDEVKVSLRSNYEEFDVSKIAMSLGGGGHKRAAGINIKRPLEEVKTLILEKALNELKSTNGENGKK